MGQSPFTKGPSNAGPPINRRRSTRIEHITPIVISGRNASGQAFREATETVAVSAHGGTIKTQNQILIGMQLMVENVLDGSAEKAICIRVVEPEAGQGQHTIAIQLLHPKNIWGVKDPPGDWEFALGTPQPGPSHAPVVPAPNPQPGDASPLGAAAPPPSPASATSIADFDQRASEFAESVLVLLRRQASGMLRESLKEFEERLRALEAETLQRVTRLSDKAVADTEISINVMQQKLLEKIAGQAEEAASLAQESFRERMTQLFAPQQHPAQALPPEKKTGTD